MLPGVVVFLSTKFDMKKANAYILHRQIHKVIPQWADTGL